MKINKINDNQIKCILSQQDLEERHLNLREMSYNSTEIRKLFAEIIHIAYKNFGFEANNVPLKIDVIPLRSSAVLFFTKVEEPEELNPSYSHFSPSIYEKMQNPTNEDASNLSESFKNLINALFPADEENGNSNPGIVPFASKAPIIFSFGTIFEAYDACVAIRSTYNHLSTLYFDSSKNIYYLKLFTVGDPDDNFRQNCITLLEYGDNVLNEKFFEAYLTEHAEVLIENHAVNSILGK